MTFELPGTTFTHYLAKQQNISSDMIADGDRFDMSKWPPLFFVDILQLPGTLANVLKAPSGLELVEYSTYGSRSVMDGDITAEVDGIVVFGRGKQDRAKLKTWYGHGFVRGWVSVGVRLSDRGRTEIKAYQYTETTEGVDVDDDTSDGEAGEDSCEEEMHDIAAKDVRDYDLSGVDSTVGSLLLNGRHEDIL